MKGAGDSGTSPTLLSRLRRSPSDQAAWNEFVARYSRQLQDWCRQWGLQQADADDLIQNVLLDLSRQMSRFAYDPARTFRGWLKTVAYRAWCDLLERRSRDATTTGGSVVMQVLQNVEARDGFMRQLEEEWDRELLERAMANVRARVQEHTWQVFRLMTQQTLSGPEVAERLNMKVGAVWVAKSKVQRMLREEISRLEGLEQQPSAR